MCSLYVRERIQGKSKFVLILGPGEGLGEDYLNNSVIHLSVGKLKWIVQRAVQREINELLHFRMNSRLRKLLILCA